MARSELRNLGVDPTPYEDMIEEILGSDELWRVELIGQANNVDWALRVTFPDGTQTIEILHGTKGQRTPGHFRERLTALRAALG